MGNKNKKASKIISKSIKYSLLAYVCYFLISGVLIFYIQQPEIDSWQGQLDADRFYRDQSGQDRVVLVEDRVMAGFSRLDLMAQAEESLEVNVHAIYFDQFGELFLAGLLAAADRGVQVRIILDGLFGSFHGRRRSIQHALVDHPNITLKHFERVNLLMPWTLHNRMHDKFIIVDDKYAMIGGRNIGDRYFAPADEAKADSIVEDRDVVIVNTRPEYATGSVICELKDYFQEMWQSKYLTMPAPGLTSWQKRSATARKEQLLAQLDRYLARQEYSFDWYELSVPTNSIRLIRNPLNRLNKEPWLFAEITNLIHHAEESVVIQSPYVVPTSRMLDLLDCRLLDDIELSILTNSMSSSPNPFTMAGYRHRRNNIIAHTRLYEYHGQGSVHAKSIIIDDRLSLVGSFNMDSRSTFLSTETMVVIDSVEFAGVLREAIDELQRSSMYITDNLEQPGENISQPRVLSWPKQALISVLSFFALFMAIFL